MMNLGQRQSSTAATPSALPALHTEDKDNIYTFSNDESDFMDSKYGSRLSANVTNTNYPSGTDKNLNDTKNFALKESIRTYSKKKVSSSVSPRNDRKKTPTQTTTCSTTPSCSPLQRLGSVPLSPFSDESNSQMQRSNGSAPTGNNCISETSIIWPKFSFSNLCTLDYQHRTFVCITNVTRKKVSIGRKTKIICNGCWIE